MKSLVELITGRKLIERTESKGLDLALQTINEFSERTFRFRGMGLKVSGVAWEYALEFIKEDLPEYYTYTTRIKKYIDRKGVLYAKIEVSGVMGMSELLNRHNPFDLRSLIRTESTRLSPREI